MQVFHRQVGRGRAGFTAIEIVVSIIVAAIAVLVSLVLANGMTNQLRNETQVVGAQDNARVAIDEITRLLRGAGSGTDNANGQDRFLYAGPYTIALNANMLPIDDPAGTGEPAALDPALDEATVPLGDGQVYTPPMAYGTGAETVVLTIDSSRDGAVGEPDAVDDDEEESENPNDYVLKSHVYGRTAAGNAVTTTGLAVLRGPTNSGSEQPEPLFQYWVDTDNDPVTPALLHGDTDADGRLSPSEAAAVDAIPADQLALIDRINVVATAEGEKPRQDATYSKTVLRSSVSFRNRSTTASRLSGVVFHDLDGDGAQDSGELGIRDVVILCSNNTRTKTNVDGRYIFTLTPGIYTLTEVDPARYRSTTPNVVQVNPAPGDLVRVDFGDISTTGTGRITGLVFNDADADGEHDIGEPGISGVRLLLDTGAETYTSSAGRYNFTVEIQDYIVTEEDSIGYTSITPNVVEVNLINPGDSVVVDFADFRIADSGIIHGIVYRDDDNDGTRDAGEPGVQNVTITLDDTQTTTTDAQGEFQLTAIPGEHSVVESDPPGYTSSTLNNLTVTVLSNQTVEVAFGDIAEQDISFQEIVLGNTERALSITSLDTGEDTKTDMDIALGTHYVGGRNDLLVWWNNRANSTTPNSAIFATTPSYQRVIAADVNGLQAPDLNGDGRNDVISVLGTASNNVGVWVTQGTGVVKGQLPTAPSALYTTPGVLALNDVVVGHFDLDGTLDFVAGGSASLSGRIQVWHGAGGASFTTAADDVYDMVPGVPHGWGDIRSLAVEDFNGDGRRDVVVGARTGLGASVIYVLLFDPARPSGKFFRLQAEIPILGDVTDVLALDMGEDDGADIDILVGLETVAGAGRVEVWNNRGNNHFGIGDIPDTTPDDTADPGGTPLSLSAARLDNDVYPDLVVGTRRALYSGQVVVYRAYGYLPTNGTVISASDVGEVITMTTADYNKDGAPDLAVGTRTSSTSGKVVIYFNQRAAL